MTKLINGLSRRNVIKSGAVGAGALAMPLVFTGSAGAYTNEPTGSDVTFGFNVPQTGAYADEGADELRAYELAV
ncbi:MAG: branched-chain amino acid ABC transporter substrate-binding protein, partial [Rhizobiaceae bacterium]|nr:branched-chain amino acid ABC transporter substrate-binding protein [Rhizobiaceae bacterium]